MVKHVVMWRVNESQKSSVLEEMKSRLESLRSAVSVIKSLEVGINKKESDAAFDVSLITAFETWDDLKTYARHPEHVKVAGFINSVTADRCVVDYEI